MSINDPDFLKEIQQKIDETDWSEIFKREKEERKQGISRVSNKEYCNWLEAFINNLPKGYNDESWAYKTLEHNKEFTEEDLQKEKDLSYFYKFLTIVADIQRVKEYYDTRDFEEFEYAFKYNDKYYEYNTLVGQGSITRINQIEKPEYCVVDLDLYFKREEEGNPMRKYKFYWRDEDEDDEDIE